jgi:hypothetical protein
LPESGTTPEVLIDFPEIIRISNNEESGSFGSIFQDLWSYARFEAPNDFQ